MKQSSSISMGSDAGTVTTVVIGAGHAGLAISQRLSGQSIDHVVLERGEIANSWHTERWDSLRLLTPNWQNALPGYRYEGGDPDGYSTMPEISKFINGYAKSFAAPVRPNTLVTSVKKTGDGYLVQTSAGIWKCRSVVLASGACNKPAIPKIADALPASIRSLAPMHYCNPAQLDTGGVLIVGASATGLQLAQEIQRSGRQVTLAVGEHVRMPRTYRGRDIQWWMDAAGILDRKIVDEDDVLRARRVPSPQLIGTPDRESLDLNVLTGEGVSIVGRLAAIREETALFSGSLRNCCAMADLKLNRLLSEFDEFASTTPGIDNIELPERLMPTQVAQRTQLKLNLSQQNVRTVIWATGYRPDYTWLDVPVLDQKGKLCHDGGVVGKAGVESDGLYAMGLTYMRRRKSSFIYGATQDAMDITEHLYNFLDRDAWQRRNKSLVSNSIRRIENIPQSTHSANYRRFGGI